MHISEFYQLIKTELQRRKAPDSFAASVHKQYNSPFFTLISIILSARTKDSLTATKMPKLWQYAGTPEKLLQLSTPALEELLRPIGFYKTKAQHLQETSKLILDKFGGKVPNTMDELLTLPGVGRKTANLTLSIVFKLPAICVDTHVHRLMNYIGYVTTKTPEETEKVLREKLPAELWNDTNELLVLAGQTFASQMELKKDPENIFNKYKTDVR